ncbi:hypothetical protein KC853_03225 [Candidatus Saccharibacteria bacterium]|nr:hypothetical protein [Candidatus Saccharibacteria bacterium]MCB9834403.1 hypothetical protein [Candidatus Nomurabacteria bacterium]
MYLAICVNRELIGQLISSEGIVLIITNNINGFYKGGHMSEYRRSEEGSREKGWVWDVGPEVNFCTFEEERIALSRWAKNNPETPLFIFGSVAREGEGRDLDVIVFVDDDMHNKWVEEVWGDRAAWEDIRYGHETDDRRYVEGKGLFWYYFRDYPLSCNKREESRTRVRRICQAVNLLPNIPVNTKTDIWLLPSKYRSNPKSVPSGWSAFVREVMRDKAEV